MKTNPIADRPKGKEKVSVTISRELLKKIDTFRHPDKAIGLNSRSAKIDYFLRKSVV